MALQPHMHTAHKHPRALHSAPAGYNEPCKLKFAPFPSLNNEGPNF